MKKNVALLLFDDVEVLDFAGPFEVFAVTDELRDHETFNVYTVAETARTIRARNGLNVVPHHTFADAPSADILIIPGGYGTRALLARPEVLAWIQRQATAAEIVMSVCTGALLLAKLGLLDGLAATTHHELIDMLIELAPKATVLPRERFTDNGKICTSAGISAGIDLSLHLVARLLGDAAAQTSARYMEYERR